MASTSKASKNPGNLPEQTEIYLIGRPCGNITGNKLPSRVQVLRKLMYGTRCENMTVHESAYDTTDTVLQFWNKVGIPTMDRSRVKFKVCGLLDEWRSLSKNKNRSNTLGPRAIRFSEALDDLFDIAQGDALKKIKSPEIATFLEHQRMKGRRGTMADIDAAEVQKQKRQAERDAEEAENRRKRAKLEALKAASGESIFLMRNAVASIERYKIQRLVAPFAFIGRNICTPQCVNRYFTLFVATSTLARTHYTRISLYIQFLSECECSVMTASVHCA